MRVALGIPVVQSVSGTVYHAHLSFAMDLLRSVPGEDRREVVVLPVVDIFPHSRAREEMVKGCIGHECDLLFFLDADMVPAENMFATMWRIMDTHKVQMVAGHTYRRGFPYTSSWTKVHDGTSYQATSPANAAPSEIDACGMACNLIDIRWCLTHMERPLFYQDATIWEDTYFCNKLTKAGGRILTAPSVRCGHVTEPLIINDDTADWLRSRALTDQTIQTGKTPD